ncbi:MAG: hypothetical protein EXS02_01885 [Planctomycetes bacterium]|nr:hypothetical protein [Planctomycetota bacterium]
MYKTHSVLFALAAASALIGQEGTKETAPVVASVAASVAVVELGSGAHRYRWVHDWGRLPSGKEIGNTHGCMVIDKSGRILVNTDTEHAVLMFSPAGEVVGSFGKEYGGGMHGMCLRVEDQHEVLYLAHTSRHEVLKATIEGKVLWTISWPEASGIYEKEDQYNPTAIAVAADGRIFVADGYGRSWVHIYDSQRKYLKSFGGPGTDKGKFQTPHGLLLDNRGKEPLLLVCDRANHRLQWFTLDGTYVRMMDKDLRLPCNAWPLADGELAVADLEGRVSILGKDDKVMVQLGDTASKALQGVNGVARDLWEDGMFFSPHSVCADSQGNLFVMDWNSVGRITKLLKLAK